VVTVFGGSGFVGRHVVRALAKRGYRVRVAVRRPDLAGFLQPMGDIGQITAVQANLRVRWSIERALDGADAAINLVGILFETGRQTFAAVQEFGSRPSPRPAGNAASRWSTCRRSAPIRMARRNMRAPRAARKRRFWIRSARRRSSCVRRSSSGRRTASINKFADMARFSPALPLIGGGATKFQPVYVGDVAEAFARAVDGELEGGKVYELGGPE
jgi:uncharacterized protein YbjT (DUF2867 family)